MVLSLLYPLARELLDVLMLACRGDRSKDPELLVLHHAVWLAWLAAAIGSRRRLDEPAAR
jgi:hypothetical protein